MKTLNRVLALWLVLSLMGLTIPSGAQCAGARLFSKAELPSITPHDIRILSTPEEPIPFADADAEEEKKGVGKWVWVVLGVLAIGGAALALGGGGDDGGTGGSDTGDITFGW